MRHNQISYLFFFLWFFVLIIVGGNNNKVNGAEDDLEKKCSEVVQKVIPCLNFATGKAAKPSKDCCAAAAEMKESNPACLCYIIQQTHDGNEQSKSLGIQEPKLLELPSACNVNANISRCPTLLGLSPNSPDIAIFKNSSKVTPPSPSSSSSSSSSSSTTPASATHASPQSQNDSYGTMLRPPMIITDLMLVALAFVLFAVPTGFVRIHI